MEEAEGGFLLHRAVSLLQSSEYSMTKVYTDVVLFCPEMTLLFGTGRFTGVYGLCPEITVIRAQTCVYFHFLQKIV